MMSESAVKIENNKKMTPSEVSLAEIRKFMLENDCKVTNHVLVKHFKKFLTNPGTQNEARKQFKTYVNVLATIKTENNEKYLILRKKYLNECPPEDIVNRTEPMSPGAQSLLSDGDVSPFRQPPPYKPPPQVSPASVKVPILQEETKENYRDCVNEFAAAVAKIDSNRLRSNDSEEQQQQAMAVVDDPPSVPPRKRTSAERSVSRESFDDDNKENNKKIAGKLQQSEKLSEVVLPVLQLSSSENDSKLEVESKISVKEATQKFNRLASVEEAKVISPSAKKRPEKAPEKAKDEVTLAHPKAKEWIVAAAKSNYQELAKLAIDHPELVKLKDWTTALHFAAKHGNEDVIKLIAGKHKADVHARTNGGYTPLHLAIQFGRDNIFELLCNVYKANRDLTDWSGRKPLDYCEQKTTVSASTYSKIKARKKHSEKDLGFLRIGSLNVRVKKTTEAFSNFLGVGSGSTSSSNAANHHHHQTGMMTSSSTAASNRLPAHARASAPPSNRYFEKIHKNWGSADNIPHNQRNMPPPKNPSIKKKRSKRDIDVVASGYSSMPTTPNQLRAPIGVLTENPKGENVMDSDSDSACGFDSSWSNVSSNKSIDSAPKSPPTYI